MMSYGIQLQRLVDSVENHDVRLSRDVTVAVKPLGGKAHFFSVVSTEPGVSPKHLRAIAFEYDDGGYDLFLSTESNRITADVEAVCGLPEGEGTLVD